MKAHLHINARQLQKLSKQPYSQAAFVKPRLRLRAANDNCNRESIASRLLASAALLSVATGTALAILLMRVWRVRRSRGA